MAAPRTACWPTEPNALAYRRPSRTSAAIATAPLPKNQAFSLQPTLSSDRRSQPALHHATRNSNDKEAAWRPAAADNGMSHGAGVQPKTAPYPRGTHYLRNLVVTK